jgi:hypothetical protein
MIIACVDDLNRIEPFRFYRYGALHLPLLAQALFELPCEPLLTIEAVDVLENGVRRLSDRLFRAVCPVGGESHYSNLERQLDHGPRSTALGTLRRDPNIRRLGRELITESRRLLYFYNQMTPTHLGQVTPAAGDPVKSIRIVEFW